MLRPFDADVYVRHFTGNYVGYRSDNGAFKVIEQEGLLGVVPLDHPSPALMQVDLYEDVNGDYLPILCGHRRLLPPSRGRKGRAGEPSEGLEPWDGGRGDTGRSPIQAPPGRLSRRPHSEQMPCKEPAHVPAQTSKWLAQRAAPVLCFPTLKGTTATRELVEAAAMGLRQGKEREARPGLLLNGAGPLYRTAVECMRMAVPPGRDGFEAIKALSSAAAAFRR